VLVESELIYLRSVRARARARVCVCVCHIPSSFFK